MFSNICARFGQRNNLLDEKSNEQTHTQTELLEYLNNNFAYACV